MLQIQPQVSEKHLTILWYHEMNVVMYAKHILPAVSRNLKQHQSSDDRGFWCEVIISYKSCATLASKIQLETVVMFCCHSSLFLFLGVDATFELGDFYMPLTIY